MPIEQADSSSSLPSSTFKHKATKHRSLKRADEALPYSPRKKKEIVTSLAKKYNIRIQLQDPKRPVRKTAQLNNEEKMWIVAKF